MGPDRCSGRHHLDDVPVEPAIQASSLYAYAGVAAASALTAYLTSTALTATGKTRPLAHAPATVLLFVVIGGMVSGASTVDPGPAAERLREPGSFRYDAAVYRQTHLLMVEDGLDYYEAFVTAASQDARLIEQESVRDGKFVDWATSPNYIRLPYLFWLWEAVRSLGMNVFQFSMIASSLVLIGSYWAFYPVFRHRAAIMPALLYPWFVAHATWVNLFFPDFWAGLFGLASLFLILRERWLTAGAFALAAALCREAAAIWLVLLIFAALVPKPDRQTDRNRRDILFYLGCFALFWVAVYLHQEPAARLITDSTDALPVSEMLGWSAARPLLEKFVNPAGHVMYPYGFFAIPPIALVVAAPIGYWLSLKSRPRRVRATVLAGSVFWLGFTLIIGAPSSYWGQLYTAQAVLGTTALMLVLAGRQLLPLESAHGNERDPCHHQREPNPLDGSEPLAQHQDRDHGDTYIRQAEEGEGV